MLRDRTLVGSAKEDKWVEDAGDGGEAGDGHSPSDVCNSGNGGTIIQ